MPMPRLPRRFFRSLTAAIVLAGALFAAPDFALADKLHLKDGRVIDCTVVRETDAFVQVKLSVGGIETVKIFQKSEVTSVVKDTPASPAAPESPKTDPRPDAKPDPAAAGQPAGDKPALAADKPAATGDKGNNRAEKIAERAKRLDGGASRVAILNFGAPLSWHDEIADTVGIQVNAAAWKEAVKLLDKDNVDTVVVRINSGGGLLLELSRFNSLFENVYKKKYRTVAWIESAISAAAMAPYVLEEFYFMPHGSLGACTGFSGALKNVEGVGLQMVLLQMEEASALGRRSPAIMRSMQIQAALSATIDPDTGEVTWFQDKSGEYQLNPPDQIFTFTANDAVKFKFARAIAANKEELVAAMGLKEVVWAGVEATRFIDENMRATDRTEKRWQIEFREFQLYFGLAGQTQDPTDRGKFVGKALAALREMKRMFATNANFGLMNNIDDEWFENNERELKKLLRKDK